MGALFFLHLANGGPVTPSPEWIAYVMALVAAASSAYSMKASKEANP